jgi:hypothetical protein
MYGYERKSKMQQTQIPNTRGVGGEKAQVYITNYATELRCQATVSLELMDFLSSLSFQFDKYWCQT